MEICTTMKKNWGIIALCIAIGIIGILFFIFQDTVKTQMNSMTTKKYSISGLEGRPYKVPLFDKVQVKLSDGEMKFVDGGKEFILSQYAEIVTGKDVAVLPIKISNTEGKVNYFLSAFIKEGNNMNQKQNALLGASVKNQKMYFDGDILRVQFESEDAKTGKIIQDERFYNMKGGKFAPYFPYIDNGAIGLEIIREPWIWKETKYGTGTIVKPKADDFSILFDENGHFSANTDCNDLNGKFVMSGTGSAIFGNIIGTKKGCQDSLESEFANMLYDVKTFTSTGGVLTFGLKTNSGSMIFETAKK